MWCREGGSRIFTITRVTQLPIFSGSANGHGNVDTRGGVVNSSSVLGFWYFFDPAAHCAHTDHPVKVALLVTGFRVLVTDRENERHAVQGQLVDGRYYSWRVVEPTYRGIDDGASKVRMLMRMSSPVVVLAPDIMKGMDKPSACIPKSADHFYIPQICLLRHAPLSPGDDACNRCTMRVRIYYAPILAMFEFAPKAWRRAVLAVLAVLSFLSVLSGPRPILGTSH